MVIRHARVSLDGAGARRGIRPRTVPAARHEGGRLEVQVGAWVVVGLSLFLVFAVLALALAKAAREADRWREGP